MIRPESHRHEMEWTPWRLLAVTAVIGLLARIWVIWHGPGYAFAVDQLFDTLAWNLVSWHQFTRDGPTPAAHVGPLYPMVLALFYSIVGHRPEWVPALHVVFDLGTAWCIYRIGCELWGSKIGAWTAAIIFLYPSYWTYDARIRSEAFLTLLISAWLLATVMCVKCPSHRRYAVTGLLAGLAILCKSVTLVLAMLVIGLLWTQPEQLPKKIAYLSIYGVIGLAVVIPWSARNYVEFNQVIPVSAGIGTGLWMGSDPVSHGSWPISPEREQAIWASAGITPLPHAYAMYDVATDHQLRRMGMDRIAADPLSYVGLTLTRVWDFWIGNSFYLSNGEGGIVRGVQKDAADRGWAVAIYSLLKRLLVVPGLIVIATCSAWVHRTRWRDLLPLYLFPIGLTAGYVPFTVEAGRYALPVLPCLVLLSVALVSHVLVRGRTR